MSPDTTPVSKKSIGGLAFQLFRTPFGATSSSGRDFDGRNLKNAQTKSDSFLIGLSRAITLKDVELDFEIEQLLKAVHGRWKQSLWCYFSSVSSSLLLSDHLHV